MEILFWGGLLRFTQALFQAAPTILIGLVVAGVFRRLLGYENTRRVFGGDTWRSLPQAWAVGMLLPVCSLGVIPVVREMKKAGVPTGATLAFGMTAPLFNPISVLYGLTLADPLVICTFCFFSLLIVTIVGLFWDRVFRNSNSAAAEPPPVAHGIRRMVAIFVAAAREAVGPSAGYIAAGLLGVALLSVVLPSGSLQTAAEHDDLFAPLRMTAIAIPAYATPMTAMVQLASMFQHGNSVGAAFALLVLGAGLNLGLLAWMMRNYTVRRTAAWLGVLCAVVVGLAYLVDRPLYPQGVEPAGHTHAFDGYCCPFPAGQPRPLHSALAILRDKLAPHEVVGLISLAVIAGFGLVLRFRAVGSRLEAWLEQPLTAPPRFDVTLPGPVLGGVAFAGLIAASVFGCYLYYPPPEEIFEEMRLINVDVVSATNSRDWDTAAFWIPTYDDWTRKLQVSMVLRGRELTDYRRAKAAVLRDHLELLEHEVEDREEREAEQLARRVNLAFRRLRAAYSEP